MTNYGEVKLKNGHKFRWKMTGTTKPEVYGWIERENGSIITRSAGWWRTTDPEAAAKTAAANFSEEIGS